VMWLQHTTAGSTAARCNLHHRTSSFPLHLTSHGAGGCKPQHNSTTTTHCNIQPCVTGHSHIELCCP
jgi:hypothetical protein